MRRGDRNRGRIVRDLRLRVLVLVEHEAEELEALQNTLPHRDAVLADAPRQHDAVEPAHRGGIGADVLADAMREHRDREAAAIIAFGRALLDVAEVVADAREAGEAALLVEELV